MLGKRKKEKKHSFLAGKERDGWIERDRQRERESEKEGERKRERERQAGKQADRQTE